MNLLRTAAFFAAFSLGCSGSPGGYPVANEEPDARQRVSLAVAALATWGERPPTAAEILIYQGFSRGRVAFFR